VHSERRRSIIVWGPTGSGKSVYLTSLVMWLAREGSQRQLALLPADGNSADWIARRTFAHGDGLRLTPREPENHQLLFRVYETSDADDTGSPRSRVVAELTVGDGTRDDPSRARLTDAVGVLLLLPAPAMSRSATARAAHVSWLTAALAGLPETPGAAPAVSMPVAVCLTQTDAIPDAGRRDAVRWLESFGNETMSALRAHCARFQIFKLSALGHTPRVQDGVETLGVTPEPDGVLAPIQWVLAQTEAVS
jgi:hypothetical protein